MWIKRPSKEFSVSLTFFMIGYMVATLKLLISGLQLGSVQMQPFSGTDYAAVVGSLGAIYAFRRNSEKKLDKSV